MDRIEQHQQKALRLPLSPGVYLMKGADGEIIYVGKAKALKNRVSQYFTNIGAHNIKTQRMVLDVRDFDFIVTATEMDALILECSLIKHYQPRYNILLKDDKTYPYIHVSTDEAYPRVTLTRRRPKEDKGRFFGPYSGDVGSVVAAVNKAFGLPTCKRSFPKEIGGERPCLDYHIHQCCGVCTGGVTPEDYAARVDGALRFLQGDSGGLSEKLTDEMEKASDELRFEDAAELRDRIRALRILETKQQVVAPPGRSADVIALCKDVKKSCFKVFLVRGGILVDSQSHFYDTDTLPDDPEARASFLGQFYPRRADISPRVLLDGDVADAELMEGWLSQLAGRHVTLTTAPRGDNKKLVDMARRNAREAILIQQTREEREHKKLLELASYLGMKEPPVVIEASDISHTAGGDTVGVIIRFENGAPKKSRYKRFRIQSAVGGDDYEAHREILRRRLSRAREGDEGFTALPELFLIDGGAGHVSAALDVMREFSLSIPVFGMVKDGRHHIRALVGPEGELEVPVQTRAFRLLYEISEEVHRFAITYHRERRAKTMTHSVLLDIPGVGEARAAALHQYFQSMAKIRAAAPEELAAAPGMTRPAAEAVWRRFHADASGKGAGTAEKTIDGDYSEETAAGCETETEIPGSGPAEEDNA